MHGASLTVLNMAGAPSLLVECLDATTTAPAWVGCDVMTGDVRRSATEFPEIFIEAADVKINLPPLVNWNDAAAALEAAAEALAGAEGLLTTYDTIVGDGDCGITMKRGAVKALEGGIPTDHPVLMFAALAEAISASMGGTSGVLLELMFRKMSATLSRCDRISEKELALAFQAGVDAISLYGGAKVGARTMLDALVPAATSLVANGDLSEAAKKAQEGAESTAKMKSASAGRSNYLNAETLEGTPDPGAVAVAVVLDALVT